MQRGKRALWWSGMFACVLPRRSLCYVRMLACALSVWYLLLCFAQGERLAIAGPAPRSHQGVHNVQGGFYISQLNSSGN